MIILGRFYGRFFLILQIATTLAASHDNIHASSLWAAGCEHLPLLTAISHILRVPKSSFRLILLLVLLVAGAGAETSAGYSLGFFCVCFVLRGVLALGPEHLEGVATVVAGS